MSKASKEALFAKGSAALSNCGISEDCYACPICGTVFGRPAIYTNELTEEHVPPRSLGGRPLLLTCKSCNNHAGHTFEFAARDRELLEKKVKGLMGKVDGDHGHVQIEIGDVIVNADLSTADGAQKLKLSQKHNSPSALSEFRREMESMTLEDSFKIHVPNSYKRANIRLTDLKAGFLAVTAKFGYSYGLSPNLSFIREQLRQAHEYHYQLRYMNVPVQPTNTIALSHSRGLILVKFHEGSIALPMPYIAKDAFLSIFDDESIVDEQFQVFGLPTTFEAFMDHNGAFAALASQP